MRILWLDHATRVGRHDDWLHTKFAEKLAGYVDELFFYAPDIHYKLPDRTPKIFERNQSFKEVVQELQPDVVIMDTRSAMYWNYFPQTIYPSRDNVGELWLPKDFSQTKVFKICIEEDYQYEYSDQWYQEMGVNLILQKHYSQSIRKMELPMEFFPFSVDIDVFKPNDFQRTPKVLLAGTCIDSIYLYRMRAKEYLLKDNLIDAYTKMEIIGKDYVEALQKYMISLSCGSRYSLTPAKTFEIMASGSVLFTNRFMGIEQILDDGSYVDYNSEATDVCDKARKVISDEGLRNSIVEKALNCIKRKHTHEIRIKELLDLIKRYK